MLRRGQFYFQWSVTIVQADLRSNCDCEYIAPRRSPPIIYGWSILYTCEGKVVNFQNNFEDKSAVSYTCVLGTSGTWPVNCQVLLVQSTCVWSWTRSLLELDNLSHSLSSQLVKSTCQVDPLKAQAQLVQRTKRLWEVFACLFGCRIPFNHWTKRVMSTRLST